MRHPLLFSQNQQSTWPVHCWPILPTVWSTELVLNVNELGCHEAVVFFTSSVANSVFVVACSASQQLTTSVAESSSHYALARSYLIIDRRLRPPIYCTLYLYIAIIWKKEICTCDLLIFYATQVYQFFRGWSMARTSRAERNRRRESALTLVSEGKGFSDVVTALMAQWGCSRSSA